MALLLGFCCGSVSTGVSVWLVARKRHEAHARRVRERVAPVLERRAAALGLPVSQTVRIGVDHEGELELRGHESDPLVALAEAIEAHEQGHLGFIDTVRVSRDEVDQNVRTTNPSRRRAS